MFTAFGELHGQTLSETKEQEENISEQEIPSESIIEEKNDLFNNNIKIDLSGLSTGMYLIRVESANKSKIKRIVIR